MGSEVTEWKGDFMKFTEDQLLEMMDANDGDLCLSALPITELPDGLEVKRNLDLSNSALTALPKDLHVGRDLILSRSAIQTLPEDLIVGECLNLTDSKIVELPPTINASMIDCRKMSRVVVPNNAHYPGDLLMNQVAEVTIGRDAWIDGDLNLNAVTNLEELPPGLKVGGSLRLWKSSVERLGVGTEIGGDFDLKRSAVVELPEGLIVGGKLTICVDGSGWDAWYPKITSLPSKMRVGSLHMRGTRIRELPGDLVIKNALEIEGDVARIPMRLNLAGRLFLRNIEHLEAGSFIGGSAYISSSSPIEIDSITVMGGADFEISQLRALTGKCEFGEDLMLPPTIEELPEELHVPGTLQIGSRPNDNVALKKLPRKLYAGELIIKGATIETWPEEIQIDGGITLRGGKTSSLPAALTEVNGSLCLNEDISELPDGLRVVHGNLEADGLASLGQGPLRIEGNAILQSRRLRSLPEGLTVTGDLELRDSHYNQCLKELPRGLKVGGKLDLPPQKILMPLLDDLEVGDEIWWDLPDWSEPEEFSQNLETLRVITEKWEVRKKGKTLFFRRKAAV